MQRNDTKQKSIRKPLRDLSSNNNIKDGGGCFPKCGNAKKKSNDNKQIEEASDNNALDRLLLVQSDISKLLQQIDELVMQALKVKTMSKEGKKEIESFTHVLSHMSSTLKPWVPRFQRALSSSVESENRLVQAFAGKSAFAADEDERTCEYGSPEDDKEHTLISPSPLVSWRVNCTVERNKQVFLLTPLPILKALSSKHQEHSKSLFESITSNHTIELPPFATISGDTNDDLLEGVPIEATPRKPSECLSAGKGNTLESAFVVSPMVPKGDHSMLMMTPCLKMSPPKSCILLEPISGCTHRPWDKVRKSTPFPVGMHNCGSSQSSESSGSEASEDLAFKYPELLGIQQARKSVIQKKEFETSPDWSFSPPKSCVLLEPPDEKSLENVADVHNMLMTSCDLNQQTKLSVLDEKDVPKTSQQARKSIHPAIVESTPLWKELESTMRTGKLLGENTLKKELWTRFEAASSFGIRYNASALQTTARKGFLDMLEEASFDEGSSLINSLR
ncbi:uncharacterized protein LOC123212403 isoform X2 [Mangifera indica]|uniref:uncharacterized protein LOC123206380 isoform X2 n=1 Tax=Mangifera indica TaxID=29780 RepID=UPI001CFBBCDC|nr:uncharacterized protein LOC123206380 isoform X2 [Mangifera indica]XP_044487460.1 uncharacterized protein LOC123212403 isoform X2 [Mangifera indica]